jgi:two-component system nitrogen regulation response regulator GlnG
MLVVRDLSDSTLIPRAPRAERVLSKGLGVTLLHHPDPGRVGDYAMLLDEGSREVAMLSRDLPVFRSTDGNRTDAIRTRQVSRAQISVRNWGSAGARVSASADARLVVSGERIVGAVDVSPQQLAAGIVLELSNAVGLLLHTIDVRVPLALDSAAAEAGLEMVGFSNAIRATWDEVTRVGDQHIPVLLRGPSGSGKELAAALIHQLSGRQGRYVCVNMAAVTPSVAASELFGHREGSFSGASRGHQGFFEQADGGTLFLDEIGETPEAIQPMLLRAVELGVVQPVGGVARKVDVRLIAATDADLERSAAEGGFRSALLHRLAGYPIRIPSLGERLDDIPRLFVHFLGQELERTGERYKLSAAPDTQEPWLPLSLMLLLCHYAWPGNVRELRNVSQQLAIANRGEDRFRVPVALEARLRGETRLSTAEDPVDLGENAASRLSEITDADIRAALRANQFHVGRTALYLNVSRGWLSTRLRTCEGVRIAADLGRAEIESALVPSGGDTKQAALALEVSERGLVLQMRRLGLSAGG